MREVKVKAYKEYSIFVTSGGEGLTSLLDRYKIKKTFVVTDERVKNLYGKFFKVLEERACGSIDIKSGEENKSLETLADIYSSLIDCGADKKTALVAFGGGLVGDIGGFAASTFLRGIPLIQVPTTLLAQCDSSIGGKNGFDFNGNKNVIGSIYQPQFVYSDVNFLKTLDNESYSGGLAEIIKYGFIYDAGLFHFIEENRTGIGEREVDKLLHLVNESSRIKSLIIEKDQADSVSMQVLNFGHTIGNEIERMMGPEIKHGDAVALGMMIESHIALQMGYITDEDYNRLIRILKYFRLPVKLDCGDTEELLNLVLYNKKKISNNLKFSLPAKIGHAIITSEIKHNIIREAIKEGMRRKI